MSGSPGRAILTFLGTHVIGFPAESIFADDGYITCFVKRFTDKFGEAAFRHFVRTSLNRDDGVAIGILNRRGAHTLRYGDGSLCVEHLDDAILPLLLNRTTTRWQFCMSLLYRPSASSGRDWINSLHAAIDLRVYRRKDCHPQVR